ncbi:putative glucuronoxylan glucuronosyltransferase F8H [Bienertia sinuspersici]
MLVMQKRGCSWSLIAAIGSVVLLVTLVQFLVLPWRPTLDYFSIKQAQVSCTTSNESTQYNAEGSQRGHELVCRFPADVHNAVVYCGAPWKAKIGQWLSGCDSVVKEINITEKISGKVCPNDCSGQGVCNHELGECRCFHGYSGEQCSDTLYLACNYPITPDRPYGRWVVSICPGQCDTTRAMCFCGEGTKYPFRPVAEQCGFKINSSATPPVTDWGKPDLDVFTTNSSVPGWCNVDPEEAYSGNAKFKEECHCKYDGRIGKFCEYPVIPTCINQCSGHGFCRGGFCQCHGGWYGADCSVPSAFSSIREWPQWLRPAQINMPGSALAAESINCLDAAVKKKRPLIYGRHFKFECVNRLYDERNATVWTEQLYGAQMAIYESFLASPYRTLNGEEADFFFVPVLDSCIITRGDDAPHFNMQDHRGMRSSFTLEFYKKAYDHIVQHYPYWKRACYAPKEIWNSMMLVHWGNTNSKHKHSTTAYWADNWDDISSARRGSHPCFDPSKDLVLPAWKRPDGKSFKAKLWARPRDQRKTLFYFNGNLGPAYENGRPEVTYSMGIRQKLAVEFGSSPDKDGNLGKQHQNGVVVTPLRSKRYHEELASSVFCGVFPGDGWSGRMEDSILQGCIPVIIQGFNESEIEFKLANVKKIWQRFLYRDSVLREAERQKSTFGHVDDWAAEMLLFTEDDVFATLVQVLHYKLHNDPWRKRGAHSKKNFGLPQECWMKSAMLLGFLTESR